MPFKNSTPCMCLPNVGFICARCEEMGQEPTELTEISSDSVGYAKADQDGFNGDGQEYATAEEANGERMIEAAKELLDAEEV